MPSVSETSNQPWLVIEPKTGLLNIDLRELWQYRELFFFLVWREIKIRYKQTILGVAWAVIQPFFTMVAFVLLFNTTAELPTNGIEPVLFQYVGLIAWTYFSQNLVLTSNSFLTNISLVTKVYCPRIMLPVAVVLAGLVDFSIAGAFLLVLMPYYQWMPPVQIVLWPCFIMLLMLTIAGVGFWLSSLTVKYRDFRYIVTFLVQLWMVCSPLVYPASMLPESWRLWYGLNPMTGVIEGFRWSVLGQEMQSWGMVGVSVLSTFVLLITGIMYFRKTERYFADLI